MNYLIKCSKKYWSILIIVFLFVIFCSYILFNENNVIIPVHDNLDEYIDLFKILKDNNLFFEHNVIAPFLGGIDRDFLPSELKIYSLCYLLFRPYLAYHFAYLLRIVISIIGFILCDKYIIKSPNINITIMFGFVYALLPYFPHQAIGFSSLPLLFAVCYKSFMRLDLQRIVMLLCSGFLFDFVFHGMFICGYILLFFIILSFVYRRIHFNSLITLVIVSISFLITEHRFFGLLLLKRIPLHRIEQVPNYSNSVKQLYLSFVEVFRFGHYHSADMHYLIVYLIVMFAVGYILVDIIIKNNKNLKSTFAIIFANPLIIIVLFILINCAFYALDRNSLFRGILTSLVNSFKGFQFSRTLWLNPFLWYFSLFFIFSKVLSNNLGPTNKAKDVIVILLSIYLIIRLFLYPSTYNEIQCNLFKKNSDFTFSEFYSEKLFNLIKHDINYDKEDKCLCLGLHPSVAVYNGFYCLDGYYNIYPLETKHNFRKIIAPSLDANGSKYKDYFDNWGNRVYLFCDEIDLHIEKNEDCNPVELRIDIDEFRIAGGKYIISRVPILNYEQLKLSLIKKYTDNASPYSIYLYKNF